MTDLELVRLECKLDSAGKTLLGLSSVASTTTQELLIALSKVEEPLYQVRQLLMLVRQIPTWSMIHALRPSKEALISDRLLKHSDIDVKVSVAYCMSMLTGIYAPCVPYDVVKMKEIFQLTVVALGTLSREDNPHYYKALDILRSVKDVKAIMDLQCDKSIAEMFKLFLSTIRYPHSDIAFQQMESIMTRVIKESRKISDELLSIVLDRINKKEEHVSSRPWKLAEKVMMNCAIRLQHVLPEIVKSRNLNVDDYSSIVATICSSSSKEKHVDHEMGENN